MKNNLTAPEIVRGLTKKDRLILITLITNLPYNQTVISPPGTSVIRDVINIICEGIQPTVLIADLRIALKL